MYIVDIIILSVLIYISTLLKVHFINDYIDIVKLIERDSYLKSARELVL